MTSAETASPGRKMRLARGAVAAAMGAMLLGDFSAGYRAYAEDKKPGLPIIRDAETEELIAAGRVLAGVLAHDGA